jgi:hypothetical protein
VDITRVPWTSAKSGATSCRAAPPVLTTMHLLKPWVLGTMLILPMGTLYLTDPAAALSATSSVDSRIRLDWEVGVRHGRPVIEGWAYNDYGRAAMNVRLLVETLDASGNVIARDFGFVFGTVGFNGRTYFEVPIKTTGTSYRVSVTAFDWTPRG